VSLTTLWAAVPTRQSYMHLSSAEKNVFYVVMAVSLALMIAQFLRRLPVWRKGVPIHWKPDPLGSVAKFILGQRKVQSSRPKSGAPMHLMIFYGFMALFLATTLLFIAVYGQAVGIPNFHKGAYYLAYEAIFDVLGMFFVVGVAWAWGRRINLLRQYGPAVVNPETGKPEFNGNPLSHEVKDHLVLALLLLLGVGGYVLEAARMVNTPQPWDFYAPVGYALSKVMPAISNDVYRGIWWSHAALVAVFFITLPQMKIKHIFTATLTAAGHNPEASMGRLEPISMAQVEETGRIGVATADQYTQWHLLSLDACMTCGRCTEVCPAHNVGKILNPKQVVADIAKAAETGEEVAAAVSEEALWACTTCNACVEACPVLIRHVDMIVDARRHLVAEGRLSGSGATVLRQMAGTGNAWGTPAGNREDWMKGLNVPLARDGKPFEVLFWVGCAGATDPLGMRTSRALVDLLNKAGVSYACLGNEELCTGDPARRLGDEFQFQAQAEMNVAAFAKYGIKRVVTACPHCLNTLRNEYGDFGATLEVLHHTELLADLVAEGRLKGATPEPGRVTYHDPCYLARVNNTSDAPRSLVGDQTHLDETVTLLDLAKNEPYPLRVLAEPEQHGRKTLCCGAGGGRMWMDEEPNQRPSNRRLDQLVETGADTVAVACPFCRIMLDAGLKQRPDGDNIKLVDLAEMLQDANS